MVTSNQGIRFEADLDISDVRRGFMEIDRLARRAGRTVGGIGGVGGGIGRTVAAGAGIGAGLAVFEQLFERIFELFENTPLFADFTRALDGILEAAAPLVGVLLDSLTPVLVALTPAIAPLAMAFAPLVELLGTQLLVAVQLVTPLISGLATAMGTVTTFIRDTFSGAIAYLVDQLNRLPFVDISTDAIGATTSFDELAVQVKAAGDAAGIGAGTASASMAAAAASAGLLATAAGTAKTDVGALITPMDDFTQAARDAKEPVNTWRQEVSDSTNAINEATPAARDLFAAMADADDTMSDIGTATENFNLVGAPTALQLQAMKENAASLDEQLRMGNIPGLRILEDEFADVSSAAAAGVATLDAAITQARNLARAGSQPSAASQAAGHQFTPGGLGFDHVSGEAGRQGALNDDEQAALLASLSPGESRRDPYNRNRIYYRDRNGVAGVASANTREGRNLLARLGFPQYGGDVPGEAATPAAATPAAGAPPTPPRFGTPEYYAALQAAGQGPQPMVRVQIGDETVESTTNTADQRRQSE